MTLSEELKALQAKLSASLTGGPGLTKRIAVIQARIAALKASETPSTK